MLSEFSNCRPQPENETIYNTSQKIINSLRSNNIEECMSFIGDDRIKKDTELISFNVNRINSLFKKYFSNKTL